VLTDIATNCRLQGDSARTVPVAADASTGIEFEIQCNPTVGTARVSVSSTGVDLDPNGYLIVVDTAPAGRVAASSQTDLSIAAGEHRISLAGLTSNCGVEAPEELQVLVPTNGVAVAEFSVVCDTAPPAGLGRELAFLSSGGEPDAFATALTLMNADGTNLRPLLTGVSAVSWSPDGMRLAAIAGEGTSTGALVIGELAADNRSAEFSDLVPLDFSGGIAWSPEGDEIAYLDPVFDEYDLRAISLAGTPNRLIVPFITFFKAEPPSWSPDGSTIVYASDTSLQLVDADGTNDRPFALNYLRARTPAWSPDGTRIAFATQADTTVPDPYFDLDIFVASVEGEVVTRLTDAPGDDAAPSWSPDGSQIAFVSHRDGNPEIYVMNADGGAQERLTNSEGEDVLPVWRPAGESGAGRSTALSP
jgi:Tol biopolymer transport system component